MGNAGTPLPSKVVNPGGAKGTPKPGRGFIQVICVTSPKPTTTWRLLKKVGAHPVGPPAVATEVDTGTPTLRFTRNGVEKSPPATHDVQISVFPKGTTTVMIGFGR